MNDLKIMSIFSSVISDAFTAKAIDLSKVNWPNVKLDHTSHDTFFEIDFVFYPAITINLKKGRMVHGCISIKSFTKLNTGTGQSAQIIQDVASIVSNNDYSVHEGFIQVEAPELRVLDNTLSLTQTTTDIPRSQLVYLVNFSFIG